MNVRFDAEVIGELRSRVIRHNETVGAVGGPLLKLGQMKGLFKRWYGGKDPRTHALAMIDGHLAKLANDVLAKARRPFDEGRHPRGRAGEFRSTGGGAQPTQHVHQVGLVNRHTTQISGSGSADNPDLLTAAQTQVIPETRYSVLGPPIAGAAGIGLGALSGATAGYSGTAADRVATAGLRHVGGKVGGLVSGGTAHATIATAVHATRAAVGAINHGLGTNIPRPARPGAAAAAASARAKVRGRTVGGVIGGGIGSGSARLFAFPAATARSAAAGLAGPGLRGRIAGRAAGAIVGAALPGLLYAGSLAHLQSFLGPYEDALFPRRVKKLAGPLLDAPEVLAKQQELLADDTLAKANLTGLAQRIIATLRPAIPQIRGAASSLRHYGPPTGPEAAFAAHAAPLQVRRHIASRAAVVAGHTAAIAGAGAGIGAISGAALGAFNQKHPRDPHGRFSRKGSGAAAGAKIGAVAGAGLGVGLGLIAARRGHTALLEQALARLRGQEEVDGVNLPAAMHVKAREIARSAHAHAFREQHAREIGPFLPNATASDDASHIMLALRNRAVTAFDRGEGAAMGSAQGWYRYQLDKAFDRYVGSQLRRHGTVPTKDGIRNGTNLFNRVDPERLNPDQRKLWDDAVKHREATLGEIRGIYEQRAARTLDVAGEVTALKAEKETLSRAVQSLPERWDDMRGDASLAEMRTFAKTHLGFEVKATGKGAREAAAQEIDDRFKTWPAETNERLAQIEARVDELEPQVDDVRNHEKADLEPAELLGISNPFATSRRDRLFVNRPPGAQTLEGLNRLRAEVADNAVRPFQYEQTLASRAAEEQLNGLLAAQEAALQARLPKASATAHVFHRIAPVLAGRLHRGVQDYVDLTTAGRAKLTGPQKAIYDWLHANQNPAQAWATTKKLSNDARSQAGKLGRGALRNWKTISTIIGPLTAMGAIDLSQPGVKKKLRIDPRTWRTPRDMGIVTEWPDPVRRPNEALFGISYRDRFNRERFLSGIHITSKDGVHEQLPFGADVEQVRNILRGGSSQTRSEPVRVRDPKAVAEIDTLRRENRIKKAGPAGFEFNQREGGTADKAQEEVRQQLYERHVKWLEHIPSNQSTNKRQAYYNSLRDIFDAPGAEAMDAATRAGLLVGAGNRRGIFANRDKVYQSGDKEKITRELERQIHEQQDNLLPLNPDDGPHDEYTQLRRALWLAATHLKLSDQQRQLVLDRLDQAFTKRTNKEAPESAAAAAPHPATSTSPDDDETPFGQFFERLRREVPSEMRPAAYANDQALRDDARANYMQALRVFRREHPGATNDQAHRHAESRVNEFVNREFQKVAPIAGMAKLDPPRLPRVRAQATSATSLSAAPRISGAAAPQSAVAKPPSIGSDLRSAVKPAHALSQTGAYGLSQLGWEAAHAISKYAMPGGNLVSRAAQFGLEGISGAAGSYYGAKGGRAAGRALGDRSPTAPQSNTEGIVRGIGGTAGQVAFGYAGREAASRGAIAIGARILGGAAGTALDPFIGPLGTALGAAAAGAIADEGAGILYRHLSRYGAHVPRQAAARLGHTGGPPSALAGKAAA